MDQQSDDVDIRMSTRLIVMICYDGDDGSSMFDYVLFNALMWIQILVHIIKYNHNESTSMNDSFVEHA